VSYVPYFDPNRMLEPGGWTIDYNCEWVALPQVLYGPLPEERTIVPSVKSWKAMCDMRRYFNSVHKPERHVHVPALYHAIVKHEGRWYRIPLKPNAEETEWEVAGTPEPQWMWPREWSSDLA
jgi:hypothetical protein